MTRADSSGPALRSRGGGSVSQQIDDRPSVDPGASDPRRTGRTGVREAVGRVARQLPAFLLTLLRTIVDAVGWFLRRWVPKVRRYVRATPGRADSGGGRRGWLPPPAGGLGFQYRGASDDGGRVDIGGLTAEQAQTKLAAEWSRISQTDIAASAGATSENLPRSLVTIDPRASVAQVTTNRWAPWDLPRAWSSGAAVPAVGTIDEAALRTALGTSGDARSIPRSDPRSSSKAPAHRQARQARSGHPGGGGFQGRPCRRARG